MGPDMADRRVCKICGAEKPVTEYWVSGSYISKKTGKETKYLEDRCKPCSKKKRNSNGYKPRPNRPKRARSKRPRHFVPRAKGMYTRNWRKRYPEKAKAHRIVHNAIKDGTLTRPDRCARCGDATRPEAHHEDYSKPLEVVWLCHPCHLERHLELGTGLFLNSNAA